jgi:hypothetical protein
MKSALVLAGIVLLGLGVFFYFDSTFLGFGRDFLLIKYWCNFGDPEFAKLGEKFDYFVSERSGPLTLGLCLCAVGLIAGLSGVFGFRKKS